ncbi:aquaporin-9-like isoform X2 [Hippocampus zosterae]|uniref:aquaporin-9-like isoform X2 n=1 Tax=Hippocampus zosterae TaxID=109293 RepID=UPI00223E62AE|nr:aquaporin-9-like isoform X2 [Hippocampus zosterae]
MRKHCAIKHGILKEFLAEFLGTFVLVLFGCGSVAQTVLSRNSLGEPLTVHIGFSVGLMMAAYIAGGVSGGHVNPAVSLAMVILGKLKIWKFPFYVIAQFLGAFAGAAAVFGLYYDAFMDFTSGILSVTGINATGHIFASYPARHLSILGGFIDQVVGTGMLVLCILAIIDGGNIGAPKGISGRDCSLLWPDGEWTSSARQDTGGGSQWRGPWLGLWSRPSCTTCSSSFTIPTPKPRSLTRRRATKRRRKMRRTKTAV